MPTTTRRTRLLAIGAVLAAVACVPFAGTAAAEGSGAGTRPATSNPDLVPGTPCHLGTDACVQLGHSGYDGRSWLIRDDRVVKGPVPASTGGPGSDTSTGTFPVTSKDAHHVSSETRDAEGNPSQMPYAVFFGNKGEAFHGGGNPTTRTAGCVRLRDSDASYFFDNLNEGDQVEVVDSSAASSSGDESYDRHRGGGGLLGGL
ncbi:MAG: L,D-transpeptidase [Actinomycetota bacterium]|nr:L,D-transpeptidase [Actinomycetota bacterium]